MSLSANGGLADKLAQMNTTIDSPVREMIYETAWSIEQFRRLADAFGCRETFAAQPLTIQLPSEPRTTAILSLSYLLNDDVSRNPLGGLGMSVTAALKFAHAQTDWKTTLSIGYLNKDGAELFHREIIGEDKGKNEITLSLCRGQVLGDKEGILHPDGRLVIVAKVTFFTWTPSVVSENRAIIVARQQLMPEGQAARLQDLGSAMLDNFVDLGAASVLLIFQDGELRCHTFPLAAREGTV
jgi:hypothetical protein